MSIDKGFPSNIRRNKSPSSKMQDVNVPRTVPIGIIYSPHIKASSHPAGFSWISFQSELKYVMFRGFCFVFRYFWGRSQEAKIVLLIVDNKTATQKS